MSDDAPIKPRAKPKRKLRAPIEPYIYHEGEDPRSSVHTLRKQMRLLPCETSDDATANGRYAELHCLSNFSFQRGASSARELFDRAKKLRYAALAITDECSLAGIVRALEASRQTGVTLIVGTELKLAGGPKLVLLAADQSGYSDICRLITAGRRRSVKGEYRLLRGDVETIGAGVIVLWMPSPSSTPNAVSAASPPTVGSAEAAITLPDNVTPFRAKRVRNGENLASRQSEMLVAASAAPTPIVVASTKTRATTPVDDEGAWVARHFGDRAWIAVELHRGPDDDAELARLRALGDMHALPLVACGDVHMHVRRRRALQDVMAAIRVGRTVADAGDALFPNGERHLRKLDELETIYGAALLAESVAIAERCRFRLDGLNYEYPHELVPKGLDATSYLRQLTFEGVARRFPKGPKPEVLSTIEKELKLIREKEYEAFFLTVYDIVKWARQEGILCQGRGSSANSAVCYCLGITAVNPEEGHLLFERFLSPERDEPPDIDVDFEHERREEVLQYVFDKYGRERAAIAATVICYRPKSAARDIGRALGLTTDQLDELSRLFSRLSSDVPTADDLRERGFDPTSRVMRQFTVLLTELVGFPRHLSQHVGGFVISEHPLHTLVPIENAAMADRTIIQWDKDDLETMKLLKVDCLALGMLTCIQKCFDLLRDHYGDEKELATIPRDDPATFAMIREADTIGVFQIESRAQMSMLPRLKPAVFYDLVIEVAIVRPGPIQGGMVHPYLKRRSGIEPVTYESEKIEGVLSRTLGVPIFQEQVMELLQVAADFKPGEADDLRRSMAAWKRRGGLEKFKDRIFDGMKKNKYSEAFANQIYQQIQGFGEYGFPESHSYSFALLAYASSWLKRHYPAAFTCALLNSQPMGFYQPAQLIQDLRNHHVVVLPVDVTTSVWYSALETLPTHSASTKSDDRAPLALRMGFGLVNGFSKALAARIVEARNEKPFVDVADLVRRAQLAPAERARLAESGALRTLAGHRHRARWESAGAELPMPILDGAAIDDRRVIIRPPTLREDVLTDYRTQGLSLQAHPLALVRSELARRRVLCAKDALDKRNVGKRVRFAGLVTVRQHPGTAKGVTFVTLEDETGIVNIVVWKALADEQPRVLVESTVLGVDGILQEGDGVKHLIAKRLHDYSALLPELSFQSRNFH